MAPLRVVSWNLHGLRDDRAAAIRVLRRLDADVVCLQEAPRRPSTPGTGLRLTRLADACGLQFVAGGRVAAGNAVLISGRIQVEAAQAVRLSSPRWSFPERPGGGIRRPRLRIGQQRGAAVVTVRSADLQVVVAAVHLGLDPEERVRHAAAVLDLIALRPGLPVVIAGDLNERPDGPAWRELGRVAVDPDPDAGPTFPAVHPDRRIDAVLASPSLTAVRYGDARAGRGDMGGDGDEPEDLARASDHRPVVAELVRAAVGR